MNASSRSQSSGPRLVGRRGRTASTAGVARWMGAAALGLWLASAVAGRAIAQTTSPGPAKPSSAVASKQPAPAKPAATTPAGAKTGATASAPGAAGTPRGASGAAKPAAPNAANPAAPNPAKLAAPAANAAKPGMGGPATPASAKPGATRPATQPGAPPMARLKAGSLPPAPQLERTYTYQYNALGRRDPFKSLASGDFIGVDVGGNAPPDLGSLRIVGIVWGDADRFALAEDARGNSYVLRQGDKVMNGYVEGIRRDAVLIRSVSESEQQTVTLPLQAKGESNANR